MTTDRKRGSVKLYVVPQHRDNSANLSERKTSQPLTFEQKMQNVAHKLERQRTLVDLSSKSHVRQIPQTF